MIREIVDVCVGIAVMKNVQNKLYLAIAHHTEIVHEYEDFLDKGRVVPMPK